MTTELVLLLVVIFFSISISSYVFKKFMVVNLRINEVESKSYQRTRTHEHSLDIVYDCIDELKRDQPIPSRYHGEDIKLLLGKVQELEEENKRIHEKLKLITEI